MNKSQLWLVRFDIPTSHMDCFVILPRDVFHWPPASSERNRRLRHCLRMFMEYSSSQK